MHVTHYGGPPWPKVSGAVDRSRTVAPRTVVPIAAPTRTIRHRFPEVLGPARAALLVPDRETAVGV